MSIYKLSENGRSMLWSWYKEHNWGMTHWGQWEVSKALGAPASHWPVDLTLGDIEDASPAAGRDIARVLVEKILRPELATPYVPCATIRG